MPAIFKERNGYMRKPKPLAVACTSFDPTKINYSIHVLTVELRLQTNAKTSKSLGLCSMNYPKWGWIMSGEQDRMAYLFGIK